MPNDDHVTILRQGTDTWNRWRRDNPDTTVDLSGAHLSGADLSGAHLSGANLPGALLTGANLYQADLSTSDLRRAFLFSANLSEADLSQADLSGAHLNDAILIDANLHAAHLINAILREARLARANLTGADLSGARLMMANLSGANLAGATLTGANLSGAQLLETTIENTNLSKTTVYGISAWNLEGTPADQTDLVITRLDEAVVTADDLEVAQFMYLMLHNEKLRRVIDTITSKVVLILGRFTPERKAVLDALRNELRDHNLTPVLFDFDIPENRSIRETVTLLARMARFIVADLTDPASIPMELEAIAPTLPSVPIQSIVNKDQQPFSMFYNLRAYPWVLEPYRYTDIDELLANLAAEVIAPADARREALDARGGT